MIMTVVPTSSANLATLTSAKAALTAAIAAAATTGALPNGVLTFTIDHVYMVSQ